jgi:hypothetical protein
VTVNWPKLTVSLAASTTTPTRGAPVTLTATANGDVGNVHGDLVVIDITNATRPAIIAVCEHGTACTATTKSKSATRHTYVAQITIGAFDSNLHHQQPSCRHLEVDAARETSARSHKRNVAPACLGPRRVRTRIRPARVHRPPEDAGSNEDIDGYCRP